jgi:hypothetical protein
LESQILTAIHRSQIKFNLKDLIEDVECFCRVCGLTFVLKEREKERERKTNNDAA